MLAALPELLTRAQAAAVLGVTTKTIDRMRHDGRLSTYRTERGRARRPVLVRRDDVRRALAVAPEIPVKHAGPEQV